MAPGPLSEWKLQLVRIRKWLVLPLIKYRAYLAEILVYLVHKSIRLVLSQKF
jgi:hypothetical protein